MIIKVSTITFMKITWVSARESWEDEGGKMYTVAVDCDIFDSETMENKTWNITKVFSQIRFEEITLDNAYVKVMETYDNAELI